MATPKVSGKRAAGDSGPTDTEARGVAGARQAGRKWFARFRSALGPDRFDDRKIEQLAYGPEIMALSREELVGVVRGAAEDFGSIAALLKGKTDIMDVANLQFTKRYSAPVTNLLARLFRRDLPYTPTDFMQVSAEFAKFSMLPLLPCPHLIAYVGMVEEYARQHLIAPEAVLLLRKIETSIRADVSAAGGRLAARIVELLRMHGHGPGAAASPSALEGALLARERPRPDLPSSLTELLAAALVLPPEDAPNGTAQFVNPPRGADPAAMKAINTLLQRTRGGYSEDRRSLASNDLYRTLTVRAGPGVATALCALAALSQRQIKHQFGNRRAERYHNAASTLTDITSKAFEGLKSLDSTTLGGVCDALSRYRDFEYVYPFWNQLTAVLVTLAKPRLDGTPDDLLVVRVLRCRERLARVRDSFDRLSVQRFDEGLGIGLGFPVDLGERWSDRMFLDLRLMKPVHRASWDRFLAVCSKATGSQPSTKWLKQADEATGPLPGAQIEKHLTSWFALVGKPRPPMPGGKIEGRDSSVPSDRAGGVLRGMAWAAARHDTPGMARALGDLAMACYKMVPGVGARCIKPGASAVWALAQLKSSEALSQLSRVRQLVKFGTAKKTLDAALGRLARQLDLTTDELHEIAAPDFGLQADATLSHEAGDFKIELRVEGPGAAVRILDTLGKPRASIPEAIKRDHKAALAELKQTAADIDKMLPAQKDRIERLFHADRSWPFGSWRERYHDHPLVGTLSRRLIWTFEADRRSTEALWVEGRWMSSEGASVDPSPDSTVRLWHPIVAKPASVLAWRSLLEDRRIRQPFKQAHREVYVLTDAERRTGDYSNRFAGHIIKQAQLNALCQQRGWKHTLFVLEYGEPAALPIPRLNLTARFVVSAIGDSLYGSAGASSYLQTDQVAFVRENGDRVPIHTVPPLVFSEVMRDVDLFVGICSVGLDPSWADTGGHEFGDHYWRDFSFGDLSETAKTRRDILQRLVPRLKIAPICTLEDKFLKVRGTLRTYKIHLGSGNILMEPNDEYLCIVPGGRDLSGSAEVFLPFEGDRTLAVILSKAFMLAEDSAIKDPTITRQIGKKK